MVLRSIHFNRSAVVSVVVAISEHSGFSGSPGNPVPRSQYTPLCLGNLFVSSQPNSSTIRSLLMSRLPIIKCTLLGNRLCSDNNCRIT
ncbi:hypothetical protein ACHAXM_011690 [Skeletonema potamos]